MSHDLRLILITSIRFRFVCFLKQLFNIVPALFLISYLPNLSQVVRIITSLKAYFTSRPTFNRFSFTKLFKSRLIESIPRTRLSPTNVNSIDMRAPTPEVYINSASIESHTPKRPALSRPRGYQLILDIVIVGDFCTDELSSNRRFVRFDGFLIIQNGSLRNNVFQSGASSYTGSLLQSRQ